MPSFQSSSLNWGRYAGMVFCLVYGISTAVDVPADDKPAEAQAAGEDSATNESTSVSESTDEATRQTILRLVGQLDDEQYQARDAATKRLLTYGSAAAEPLALAVRTGSLERANRALMLLAQLARPKDPDVADPALDLLREIADLKITSKSSLATKCLRDVISQRGEIARSRLRDLGISVNVGNLVIDSKQELDKIHVRIPVKFAGPASDLRWLAWLSGVEYIVAGGAHIDTAAMAQIARMPNLQVIALHRTPKLKSDDLLALKQRPFIRHLELMYMDLGESLVGVLDQLPNVQSIRLFGVPLDDSVLQKVAIKLPMVLDGYSPSGAFLGVRCTSTNTQCVIDQVTDNSAAQSAGLMADDIIIKLGELPIRDYAALRAAIATFPVETPIPIEVIRGLGQEKNLVKLSVVLRGTEP